MPNYNKNSVFAVSSAGTIPNSVDDLIFFQDINKNQYPVWTEFERIMYTGDYDAAHDYVKGYADVHGYFGDLYNLMINRIKAVQDFLVLNESNIESGTGAFSSFKKPKIFVYREDLNTVDVIQENQVWVGPKNYFDDVVEKVSLNKLKIDISPSDMAIAEAAGFTIDCDDEGYIIINGSSSSQRVNIKLGSTQPDVSITNSDIWSYWNYYVSGAVEGYTSGFFEIIPVGDGKLQQIQTGRTVNMHANLFGIGRTDSLQLWFKNGLNEVYRNLKVGFMICKIAETSPNQKFVKYEGA